ncbi:MAG: HIT family protein [Candidatus Hodarchaeales archaeon]|jgi:histidine triad (HIT) family protein
MNSNCIFCKIINKSTEAAILFEDNDVISFLVIHPVNKGHALIVPKIHVDKLEDVPEEIYLKIHSVGRNILNKIKNNIPETTGFNVIISNGTDAGQDVFHSHLHIIPRRPGDSLKIEYDFGDPLSIEERKNIANDILK